MTWRWRAPCSSLPKYAYPLRPQSRTPARYGPLQDIVSLLVVCVRINRSFILPTRLHCPQCCNTIARLLGNMPPPPNSPFVCHIPYNSIKIQYRVKAGTARFSSDIDKVIVLDISRSRVSLCRSAPLHAGRGAGRRQGSEYTHRGSLVAAVHL